MKQQQVSEIKSKVKDNYVFIKKIGSGSFGEVFLAGYKNGGYVAAKIEDRHKSPRVINEYKIYNHLHKKNFNIGLPKIYDFIQTPDYNMMFMQLLGPSLEDLFLKYEKKFTEGTVYKLALQLIELLEQLHSSNFIHRDIKPNNFLIGRNVHKNQIFMMDFGLSKKFFTKGKHIDFKDNRPLIGTARYASRNMHMGFEPSRRDDLESVGYMLIYFLKGSLPWQGLKKVKGENQIDSIGNTKMCTSIDTLCKDIPKSIELFMVYCRSLKFEETPDYNYLKEIINEEIKTNKIVCKFEWEDEKDLEI